MLENKLWTTTEANAWIDALVQTPESAKLDANDRAMLDFARKLTTFPGQIEQTDIATLRDAGFDDLAIHDMVCCISYFAFVNRIADGLGIELE